MTGTQCIQMSREVGRKGDEGEDGNGQIILIVEYNKSNTLKI